MRAIPRPGKELDVATWRELAGDAASKIDDPPSVLRQGLSQDGEACSIGRQPHPAGVGAGSRVERRHSPRRSTVTSRVVGYAVGPLGRYASAPRGETAKGFLDRSPFKIGAEPAITLEREIPRDRRFDSDEQETKLPGAANPHLRAIIIALLDAACRPGEILSLQWKDVNPKRREILIRAGKSKTRTARLVPISTRLLATLEMRKTDPTGNDLPGEAFVFGTPIGERVTSTRTAWRTVSVPARGVNPTAGAT